jgi:isoleucyl-tRNA synthetase
MAGYDFKSVEQEIAQFWEQNKDKIDSAIADENTTDKERFSFLEGPPTANAPPALHHVEARVFKDLYTRYKTLQGYKVSRKGGWDCHGLPVEVQVEKKLGLKTKKDVVEYGVEPFINECKTDIFKFVEDWKQMTQRLGFWVDLEHPYMTLNTNYMESVWWALKEIHNKDLLYKGFKIVPYCGRCATPLSSHEVAQGYKDVEDKSVVVHFPITDDKGAFNDFKTNKPLSLLAWTTTPWTLPSNLALAVHPEVDYCLVEHEEYTYVLAKELIDKYFDEPKIIGEVKGQQLEGVGYEPVFDYFKDKVENSFRVITADYVTTTDGTGIVHQAPAFGEDDYYACEKHDIDFVNPVDDNAEFTDEISDFAGRFVKEADGDLIKKLEASGKLFKVIPYVHSYPHCWRCKTPLIYHAKDTWFIKVSDDKVKQKLLDHNEVINWHPSTIKQGRFGNWLEGARDWALSRNKYWGTPLPVWVSEDDPTYYEVIGSIDELEAKTGVRVDDLHIDTVDKLTYKSEGHGLMRRTTEVIDCWFDSGSAPFAQLHYPFENKDLFEELFPYDYISEGIDQTRGWFYTMHVINTILFDKPAYKNVVVAGLLTDDNGEKMSKSKGNILNPDETFDKFSVDGVRLAMSSYALGNAVRFGPSVFKEQITPFFTTLWNVYGYVKDYTERFDMALDEAKEFDVAELEDNWMLSKLNSFIHEVTDLMDNYKYNHAQEAIINFTVDVFSRTYIKLIRDRTQEKDEGLAYVMKTTLSAIVKTLAPFAPYITEKIYRDFTKEDAAWSVHFSSWPKAGTINKDLEKQFAFAQDLIQGILAARDKAKIGVRWPLATVQVVSSDVQELDQAIIDLVLAQTNIKNVQFVDSFDVSYSFTVDYRSLAQIFGEKTGDVASAIKKNMDFVTQTLNVQEAVKVEDYELTRDCFKVEKIVPQPYVLGPFTNGEAYVDTTQDEELLTEGYAREVTRRFQVMRKDAGLEKTDEVQIYAAGEVDIAKYLDEVSSRVGATKVLSEAPEGSQEITIKGKKFTLGMLQ